MLKKQVNGSYVGVRRSFFVLLAGSNWNNARIAGLGYLNSNNTASKSNRNIGTRLELKVILGSPEQ